MKSPIDRLEAARQWQKSFDAELKRLLAVAQKTQTYSYG